MEQRRRQHSLLFIIIFFSSPSLAIDFLFNSFSNSSNATDLILTNAAVFDASVIHLTPDNISESNEFSTGRVFYHSKLTMKHTTNSNSNSSTLSSFSTSFVFSILPEVSSNPGFGLAFLLSNSTSLPGAIGSQYFGLFTNDHSQPITPLLAVEFDTGLSPELQDPDTNHIGIDLDSVISRKTHPAGYFDLNGGFVPVQMRTGQNIHVWIDFDGAKLEINVTLAPVGVSRPLRPTLSFRDPVIANYVSSEMFVGFSASRMQWLEAHRILAWSLSDTGVPREINTTILPIFRPVSELSSFLSLGAIAGIIIGSLVFMTIIVFVGFWFWRKNRLEEDKAEIEDWELEYWPHRFSYEQLSLATHGFSNNHLLGTGGFGRVYKGALPNNIEIAVKCVSHDSKQGLKEFMAEISSMGRLQHKNLVQMRGWCRKQNELMLVYDFMPNGSLNRWIFDKPKKLLGWKQRRRVLIDVAEGLHYLHYEWDQVVIHRDIKSSNVLLDSEMGGRVGDFGLAKLYQHGEAPNTTRVMGTIGYLAPEIAVGATPTAASDVYSFGVVVLEVVCGRRPIVIAVEEEKTLLFDWVRELYKSGRLMEAVDPKIVEECEVEEMEMTLKLGLACCHPNPKRRPTMKEVVALLVGKQMPTAPADLLSELAPACSETGMTTNVEADSMFEITAVTNTT